MSNIVNEQNNIINENKEDKKIKFTFQEPKNKNLSLKEAAAYVARCGAMAKEDKAELLEKNGIIFKVLNDIDFETVPLNTIRKLQNIFYLEGDEDLEFDLTDKYRKAIDPKTKKKYVLAMAKRVACGDIIFSRYHELKQILKKKSSRMGVIKELTDKISKCDEVILSKVSNNKKLTKNEKSAISKVEEDMMKLDPQFLDMLIRDKGEEEDEVLMLDEDEKEVVNKFQVAYENKVAEGEQVLREGRKKKGDNKGKAKKKFFKVEKRNQSPDNSRREKSAEKKKEEKEAIEKDEKRKTIIEEIKKKREAKLQKVGDVFEKTDSKLKTIKDKISKLKTHGNDVFFGNNAEVTKKYWLGLANNKADDIDAVWKKYLENMSAQCNGKEFMIGGSFIGQASAMTTLINLVKQLMDIVKDFGEYMELTEERRTQIAKLGNKGFDIENRNYIKTYDRKNKKNFIPEDEWKKLSPKEKIDKNFKISDKCQNPPNFLFKELFAKEKDEYFEKRKKYREKRLVEIYELMKTDRTEAVKQYDNLYHYADRDQYGFKIDAPAGGYIEGFKDDDNSNMIKEAIEEVWIDESKKKRVFNVVLVNRRPIPSNGVCSKFLKYNRFRSGGFRNNNFRNQNNKQFRNRRVLGFKRKKIGQGPSDYQDVRKENPYSFFKRKEEKEDDKESMDQDQKN